MSLLHGPGSILESKTCGTDISKCENTNKILRKNNENVAFSFLSSYLFIMIKTNVLNSLSM